MGLFFPVNIREITAARRPIDLSEASITYHFLSIWPGLARYELLPVMLLLILPEKFFPADGGMSVRTVHYFTLTSLLFSIMPGSLPLFATGLPSISFKSIVISIGTA